MKQSDVDWLVSELIQCVDEIDALIASDEPGSEDRVRKEVERLERTVREFRDRAGI